MFKSLLGLLILPQLISQTLAQRSAQDVLFSKFQQSDYVIKFERMELADYNKIDVQSFDVRTFKYNRTTTVVNITYAYNFDVGHDLQTYRFASNEYRLFPLRVEVNFCDSVKNNIMGMGAFLKCGNFTGCPMKKGVRYHYCNWAPDPSAFPPFVPNGQYMLELQGVYSNNKELFVLHSYGTISRPII